MKIAVIAKTRLPIAEPFRGGLEAFTHSLCKEYIKQGHTITLYAHSASNPDLHVISYGSANFIEDQYFNIYENDEYLSIVRDIEQHDFDIVHNNSTHELPIIWGAKASVPVVTTLHTPPLSEMKAAISAASSFDNLHFVAVSKSLQKVWDTYTNHGSKVIYNGVDLEKWPLIRRSSDYLFWYGRIVDPKGLDIALDVAHEVGMPLHFAGSLDDAPYYNQQIKPRLKPGDVYLGHLKQLEILTAMHGAAAMVNSVRWEEPFGLTNIEAMSAGVPVAGFDRGAFSELINTLSGSVAVSTTVKSLATAVKSASLLKSAVVREQAEQYSLSKLGQNYLDYFETLI
jgi:UDP-glucose:tetrahydrobiopterin glucosyltransferase